MLPVRAYARSVQRTGSGYRRSAVAGVTSAAAALGAGELGAAVLHPSASPLLSVASFVIDLTPGWLKTAVIESFGSGDKNFLLAVLGVLLLTAGAAAGVLQARRPPLGRALVLVFGLVAAGAAATRTGNSAIDVVPSLVVIALGWLLLGVLTRGAETAAAAPVGARSRRGFVIVAATVSLAGGLAALGATGLAASSRRAAVAVSRIRLPRPATPVSAVPDGATLSVPGLTPLVTPNADFYRIDIALTPPTIDPDSWQLEISGMVAHPIRVRYSDLLALPMVENRTTLMCVSNEVGGDLAGTAAWLGVPIRDLLARAAPSARADMVLSSGADGFTASTPLSVLTDARNAVLAVGMNGKVLPQEHGFPVRMVVPGLYGYVSATKWLTRLQVTRFDRATAYWTNRGYTAKAPIKLSSRIDVPSGNHTVSVGPVTIAGVAWAPHTGIGRVQVQVDGDPWRDAVLAQALSADTWRQWSFRWTAAPGGHTLRVRATDAAGLVQTARVTGVVPNGATGLHTVQVTAA